jgi:hypothetical protein
MRYYNTEMFRTLLGPGLGLGLGLGLVGMVSFNITGNRSRRHIPDAARLLFPVEVSYIETIGLSRSLQSYFNHTHETETETWA